MKKLNFGRITLIVGGAVALIGSILYIALDGSDKTFSVIAFVLGLLGAASTLLGLITDFKFSPLIPAVLYSAACALVLRVAVPSLSDVWNKVNFIGGNAVLGMTFAAVYLIAAIAAVIACFAGTSEA